MNKCAIIGAGITGLTLGHLLKGSRNVVIYEAENQHGGLIKCERVDGSLFHTCGGHVFNTRNEQVLKLFWSFFHRDDDFIESDRNAVVIMHDGGIIPYPIENHAYLLDDIILSRIIHDLFSSGVKASPSNFREFLIDKFGETLYEIYFEPYNKKIWRTDLSKIPLGWLDGKLPMPSAEEIIFNNIRKIKEKNLFIPRFGMKKIMVLNL